MSSRLSRVVAALPTPAVLVPVAVVGCWPVGQWYFARMTDGSDEPLGVLALVAAVVLLPRAGWHTGRPVAWLGAAAAILILYASTYNLTPPLVRAALAVTALAFLLPAPSGVSRVPIWVLLLLSLPVIASLQFYLGYPLRAATAWCSAHLLSLVGMAVESRGTVLSWAGVDVLIDAPCSGIRMLWMAAFLSATLAAWYHLPGGRCLRLLHRASVLVFAANLARSVVLFFLETGLWPNPPGAHDTIGLAAFALVVVGCITAARPPARRHRPAGRVDDAAECHLIRDIPPGRAARRECHLLSDKPVWAAGVVMVALVGAGAAGARGDPGANGGPAHWVGVEWPTHFGGRVLTPAPLHPVEARMARGFPGALAAFTDGQGRVVMRQIRQATRQVHPITDCLRASGFTVTPRPAWRDAQGQVWSRARAEKDAIVWDVRERWHDAQGHAWTDVSAWYWAALTRPRAGPWWSTIVFAPGDDQGATTPGDFPLAAFLYRLGTP